MSEEDHSYKRDWRTASITRCIARELTGWLVVRRKHRSNLRSVSVVLRYPGDSTAADEGNDGNVDIGSRHRHSEVDSSNNTISDAFNESVRSRGALNIYSRQRRKFK